MLGPTEKAQILLVVGALRFRNDLTPLPHQETWNPSCSFGYVFSRELQSHRQMQLTGKFRFVLAWDTFQFVRRASSYATWAMVIVAARGNLRLFPDQRYVCREWARRRSRRERMRRGQNYALATPNPSQSLFLHMPQTSSKPSSTLSHALFASLSCKRRSQSPCSMYSCPSCVFSFSRFQSCSCSLLTFSLLAAFVVICRDICRVSLTLPR
jgi:hypothetical protein